MPKPGERRTSSSNIQPLPYEDHGLEEKELWEETTTEFRSPQPWWKANFFVKEPLLFGTWDGVFTTCMLNIFGVIVFLRVGWMVGYAGIGLASLIIFLSLFVGYAVTISVIGLVRRLPMEGARCDIFHVVAYVLGRRIGGVVGLLFVFGQAVAVAMYATGLGEAMAELFGWKGLWPVRGVALGTTTLLLLIVLAGVQWVIKLQLVLLLILAIAVFDFFIGALSHSDPTTGFIGYGSGLIVNNTPPAFMNIDDDGEMAKESFFSVFAVFFPTVVGVASGINMARDIRRPERSVPIGTTAALVVSGVLYLLFAIVLAATCTRDSLRDDTLMAYRVSLVGGLFLLGLYVSSLSACLGAIYAAPRVLQSISSEKIIPLLSIMAKGRGPNNEPVIATVMIALISYVFIFVGHLNTLAVIVNMPFLLTYGALDYAYFAQAMSSPPDAAAHLYDGTMLKDDSNSSMPPLNEEQPLDASGSKVDLIISDKSSGSKQAAHAVSTYGATRRRLEEEVLGSSVPQSEIRKKHNFDRLREMQMPSQLVAVKKLVTISEERQERWADRSVDALNRMANKWVALSGFAMSLFVMFLMQWAFALGTVSISLLLYIYIGHTSPGLPPGQADFKFGKWFKSVLLRFVSCCRRDVQAVQSRARAIINPGIADIKYEVHQQTESGRDFSNRRPWHHSVQQDHPVGKEMAYRDETECPPYQDNTVDTPDTAWRPTISYDNFVVMGSETVTDENADDVSIAADADMEAKQPADGPASNPDTESLLSGGKGDTGIVRQGEEAC